MLISKSMCPGSSKAATGISFRDKSNLQKASKTLTPPTAGVTTASRTAGVTTVIPWQLISFKFDGLIFYCTSFYFLRSERYGKYGQNGHYRLGRMMWHGASLKVCLWQYTGTRATPDADGAIPHEHEFIDRLAYLWLLLLLGYLGYRTIQVLTIWWKNVNLILGGLKMWTRINTLYVCKHQPHIAVKQRSRIASSDSVPAWAKQASPDALRW